MYNEFQTINEEVDECLTRGICSVNPTISSLHEIILVYLKGVSFYLLKLKDLGIECEEMKNIIIYAMSTIITSADYNQEQFQTIISKLYDSIFQLKTLYEKTCQEKNVEIQPLKTYFKYSKHFELSDAIRKGEKYFLKKSQTFTPKQKDLYDIMLFLAKGITINLVELKRLGKTYDEAYYTVLYLLSNETAKDFSEENVKEQITKTIAIYASVVRELLFTKIETYGNLIQTEVSLTTSEGKAILVSTSDFKQLEMVLKAVENTEISVYTHGIEILLAHAFPKLHSHPNLKGHYGTSLESALIDFATFPGAVLMSKGTLQRVEYLYRGRLFTLDPIPPMGVIQIKDNNFEPLIKSAMDAKGFTKTQEKPSMKIGINEEEINNKLDEIADKIIKQGIKTLYIVGLLNFPVANKEYFQKFFEVLPKDCFAISFFYPVDKENAIYLSAYYNYVLFYTIFNRIRGKLPIETFNMNMFLTKCDKYSIVNILHLKHMGVKNIYMCKCPPTLVSPSIMQTLQETFDIKEFSEPAKDIEDSQKAL
jgi:hydroxylamine reductase